MFRWLRHLLCEHDNNGGPFEAMAHMPSCGILYTVDTGDGRHVISTSIRECMCGQKWIGSSHLLLGKGSNDGVGSTEASGILPMEDNYANS